MSKLLRVMFGGLLASGLGVYDYVQVTRAQAEASALGIAAPSGYLMSLRERLMPEAAAQHSVTLADHLLDPPEGWTRAPYETPDGEALTGQSIQPVDVLRSPSNDLLHRLRLTSLGGRGTVETYRSGDALVVISLSHGEPAPLDRVVQADFANVRGLAMALLDPVDLDASSGLATAAPYRRLAAALGAEAELTVLTNTTDEALVQVLATLDLPTLNDSLSAPATAIDPKKPILVGAVRVDDAQAEVEPAVEEIVAEAEEPKGPCIRRGTVLTCE